MLGLVCPVSPYATVAGTSIHVRNHYLLAPNFVRQIHADVKAVPIIGELHVGMELPSRVELPGLPVSIRRTPREHRSTAHTFRFGPGSRPCTWPQPLVTSLPGGCLCSSGSTTATPGAWRTGSGPSWLRIRFWEGDSPGWSRQTRSISAKSRTGETMAKSAWLANVFLGHERFLLVGENDEERPPV